MKKHRFKRGFMYLALLVLYAEANAQVGANLFQGFQSNFYGSTSNIYLVGIGSNSLFSNVTQPNNTAIGYISQMHTTTGSNNTAVGEYSLAGVSTANYNTGVGMGCLNWINSNYNTGIGGGALSSVNGGTTAPSNTGVGNSALGSVTGPLNVAIGGAASCSGINSLSYSTSVGFASLGYCRSGNHTAIGYRAMQNGVFPVAGSALGFEAMFNGDNTGNCALGYRSLYNDGNYNSAIGYESLYNCDGNYNTAVGYQASYTAGSNANANSALGMYTLYNNTGSNNTAMGSGGMQANTTGHSNAAGGVSAGSFYNNNTYSCFLGFAADANNGSVTNSMALGAGAQVDASNKVVIGNTSVSNIGGSSWWTISDGRFKKDIEENVAGISFIKQLRPVTYNLDMDKLNTHVYKNGLDEYEKNFGANSERKAKIVYTGFIAQEVEQAANRSKYDFSGVHAPENAGQHYSLSYAEFVVPMVKTYQEQQQLINEQTTSMSVQQENLDELLNEIQYLSESLEAVYTKVTEVKECCLATTDMANNSARLISASPNPATNFTIIKYYIPANSSSYQVAVVDYSGNNVRNIALGDTGYGSVSVQTDNLTNGTYYYSLLNENRIIDTRKIEIISK